MRTGAWTLVLTTLLQRNPEVWGANAEESTRTASTRGPYCPEAAHTFKPFGTGARACIGRQFALHEATLVLGSPLRRYDLAGPEPHATGCGSPSG